MWILQHLNKEARQCTPIQRYAVIKSLKLVCEDISPCNIIKLCSVIDDVFAFLLNSFSQTLSRQVNATAERYLLVIIHLLGLFSLKSEHYSRERDVSGVFEEMIDLILSHATRKNTERSTVVKSIVHIAVHSQMVCNLLSAMKAELIALSKEVDDLNREFLPFAILLNKLSTGFSLLPCWRDELKLLLTSKTCTPKDKKLLKTSLLIPLLVKRCHTNDLTSCSNVLKMFVLFCEQPLFRELLLSDFSTEFMTVFMSTMKCDDLSQCDILMKFWLVKHICEDAQFRSLIFVTKGGLQEIISIMRSVDLDIGDSLGMLYPFCDSPFFQRNMIDTSQLIEYFGRYVCSTTEASAVKLMATEVLLIVAGGLQVTNVVDDFLKSGIVFYIAQELFKDSNDGSCHHQGLSSVLCSLMHNSSIRTVFIAKGNVIFQKLATTLSNNYAVLEPILKVLADDSTSYKLLLSLRGHIMKLLSEFTTSYTSKQILHALKIIEVMASSSANSCLRFKKMNFEYIFSLIVKLNDKEMLDVVNRLSCKFDLTKPSQSQLQNVFRQERAFNFGVYQGSF